MIQELKCPYCSKVYCKIKTTDEGVFPQYIECCETRRKITAAYERSKPITYLDDNRDERRLKKDTPL